MTTRPSPFCLLTSTKLQCLILITTISRVSKYYTTQHAVSGVILYIWMYITVIKNNETRPPEKLICGINSGDLSRTFVFNLVSWSRSLILCIIINAVWTGETPRGWRYHSYAFQLTCNFHILHQDVYCA